VRRALVGAVSFCVVSFAVIGALHTAPLRALLQRGPSCPVGGDQNATPRQREETRLAALASRRGVVLAPAREAFGFKLGESNEASISGWKVAARAQCKTERAGLVQECDAGSLAHFGSEAPGTVFFRNDDAGRLVAVLVTTRLPDSQASALSAAWSAKIEGVLGTPHRTSGRAGSALLSQERSEHHFSDLLASVSATQMGEGMRVNLELQSLTARD
jgi:hypothetical protein